MSFNGLKQFSDNVKAVISSDGFQNADFAKKGDIAFRLLHSRFGLGVCGKVSPLSERISNPALNTCEGDRPVNVPGL
jgi:hypothetical protein